VSIFQSGGTEAGGSDATFRSAASATATPTSFATETPVPTETSVPTATAEEPEATPTAASVSNAAPSEPTLGPEPTEGAEATEASQATEEPTASEPEGEADRYVSADDVARFEELRDQATAGGPLYGPVTGDLVEGVGTIQGIYPEIVTTNSYIRATFTNPGDLSVPYDVGFGLRHVEGNNQLRLVITTDDQWMIGLGDQPAYQSGKAHGFQSEAGEQNTVEIVADGDTGYLAINGTVVGVLDLSPSSAAGDVWVAAGLNESDIVTGRTSTVTDFEIWALP
jgi:flagellar capping protein FliD